MTDALVIGAGPAGLMAAEMLAVAGRSVTICDAKPSFGRKFLMAGKSGLNLTKDVSPDDLLAAYEEAAPPLDLILRAFDANAVQDWARGLGQDVFTGSTGRVFPTAMKASPLLRAWLARLDGLGVVRHTRWRWQGWENGVPVFETPDGRQQLQARVTVLALGGASWARLGSDGAWALFLAEKGVPLAPFQPANVGLNIPWSEHMASVLGQALKGISWNVGDYVSRGEAIISAQGLEGGGIYTLSKHLRSGAPLHVDLLPDWDVAKIVARLSRPHGKTSVTNHLRKALRLGKPQIALLQEFGRPLPADPAQLAHLIKRLTIPYAGLRPMDEAISTAGGVPFSALDDTLMLRDVPGVFCAGEMLDWEAPTGGYLLTACLATGRWAGQAAAQYDPV
ncbi:aminoacetone oxidase family FAD-binding enzyme [Sulfitobacter sp. JL08]|uniref:TIGR03862 family flavoprotein n=1 Tax=Sulfitobacter sp. JL08 TaxID=2070369 RepID=UPI000E0AF95D|nr:TIGR03862 family flavoprotein [Sulfitobacter sp. JL08]AXI53173.1 aminoacetone oxidase family FAD-binding enzyme [Sulfitobacter sp. JL08]